MKIIRQYNDTNFITGIRAIAATMVVIIHTGAFSGWGSIGMAITYAGKYGVDIFFVIAGFTIAKTYAEANSFKGYCIRRFMRIAPLYYLAITIAIIVTGLGLLSPQYFPDNLRAASGIYSWVTHVSFLSFFDYRVANSVLGVEWSIPIEVFWYITLPWLLIHTHFLIRTLLVILALIAIALALAYCAEKILGTVLPVKLSPVAHGHLFLLGAWAFHARSRNLIQSGRLAGFLCGSVAAAVLIIMLIYFKGRGELLALATIILLVALEPKTSPTINYLLTTRPMLYVGSISYSIYLMHMVVFQLVQRLSLPFDSFTRFLIIYSLTIAVSSVTYALIERPFNSFGRKLALGS
jgi:exopolysaccharide production protein ExoZ